MVGFTQDAGGSTVHPLMKNRRQDLVQKDVLEALISEEASVPLLVGLSCLMLPGWSFMGFHHMNWSIINGGEGRGGL